MTNLIERLRQLDKEATKAPWELLPSSKGIAHVYDGIYEGYDGEFEGLDASLIVEMRNNIGKLLDLVEAVRTSDCHYHNRFQQHECTICKALAAL